MTADHFSFETLLLHNNHKFDSRNGAVSVPIQHASTFHQFDCDQFGKYDYSRSGNPTREALEEIIAGLEEGTNGFAFASGMSAISTALMLLSAGDHVIVSEDVYGGTFRMVTQVLSRFKIEHSFVDMTDIANVKSAIQPNTKAIYIETPSNPLMKVTDIHGICCIAKQIGALTFVDNTFLTPALQKPLTLGADIVLHSATKFLSGHSDVVAGLAVVRDPEIAEKLRFLQNSFGAVLGVQDAWLVMRGLKTLHVRMEHSVQSAQKIATFLESHPLVKRVHYPGLNSHPQFALQKQQAKSAGAVFSFELENEDVLRSFVSNVTLPVFAVSLGAVETILSYPAKMSHAAMPDCEREKRGITKSLLRLSAGLENPDDLIKDFSEALEKSKLVLTV
ncbi:cystathionine beta-lyase [Peribacillus huizhouensis]|uniref:cysteine-S-conjugate beta-lyase n=1 Tax=Peribacillus huizhouensis TaxID=1501239 RepID=A0ABR6CL90_9BACI|nr:cystathionine beta-lyase [Peribacillus huizhouensis]MBA9025320.1 cystathionine beta-lyase [Peribacillus huizhouensis]